MTFKFNGWPSKTIRHLFDAMSIFVRYFKAINAFKLELQSENAQFGSKSAFFLCELKIWRMSLKNNRTHLLCYFKLSISFIAIGQFKLEFCSETCNSGQNLSLVTLKFDGRPRKTIGYLFHANASFVHHFVAMFEFKLELQSANAQIETKFVLTSMTFASELWP